MSRNHAGFALFLFLLLIAPQIPVASLVGAARSNVSLGLAALLVWYLSYPKKLLYFPAISTSHPFLWLMLFAVYAFIISLLSTRITSISYAVQFLGYTILGTILFKRYARYCGGAGCYNSSWILFGIAAIYATGVLFSALMKPIYSYQLQRHKSWESIDIQRSSGFCENPNMAGFVVVFFLFACLYLYRQAQWKRWLLFCLLLAAMLATVSRSAMFSCIAAAFFVYLIGMIEPLVQRASIKTKVSVHFVFAASAVCLFVVIFISSLWFVDQSFLSAHFSGYGLTPQGDILSKDFTSRLELWKWGIDAWASHGTLRMIFGGGFRSSMTVLSERGTWMDAHNMYITILDEFGIVGLALFLVFLCTAFFRYLRKFLSAQAQNTDTFGLLVLLTLSIDNMTGTYFYSPICLSLLIFTMAVTL